MEFNLRARIKEILVANNRVYATDELLSDAVSSHVASVLACSGVTLYSPRELYRPSTEVLLFIEAMHKFYAGASRSKTLAEILEDFGVPHLLCLLTVADVEFLHREHYLKGCAYSSALACAKSREVL